MKYNRKFENFVDNIDFTKEDPCIWIVYPPGAAGDLLASIVNFHYSNTACNFFGITDHGRVIFRASDEKIVNLKYLKNKNLNYSLLDQLIFSNHAWRDQPVSNILNFFPNAKVIRILPKDTREQEIVNWLCNQKNHSIITKFTEPTFNNTLILTKFKDPRLLDIFFGDFINSQQFEEIYSNIIKHLDLEYKLVRFDLVNYWLEQQHCDIKPVLYKLLNKI
jgi:hypothetical protein